MIEVSFDRRLDHSEILPVRIDVKPLTFIHIASRNLFDKDWHAALALMFASEVHHEAPRHTLFSLLVALLSDCLLSRIKVFQIEL